MSVEEVAAALRGGGLALVPTDTVYGLAASADREGAVRRLYRVKERDESQPTALVAASVDVLLECIPELRGRAGTIAAALLPGPYTLVLPNPARRYRWLTGSTPEAIGVRVPAVEGPARELLEAVGILAASSANPRGGADPPRLEDVPPEFRALADAELDVGELPGTASTVLDFTGPEPRVLREGAAPSAEALRRIGSLL